VEIYKKHGDKIPSLVGRCRHPRRQRVIWGNTWKRAFRTERALVLESPRIELLFEELSGTDQIGNPDGLYIWIKRRPPLPPPPPPPEKMCNRCPHKIRAA